jgi:hypothetical protein
MNWTVKEYKEFLKTPIFSEIIIDEPSKAKLELTKLFDDGFKWYISDNAFIPDWLDKEFPLKINLREDKKITWESI